MYPLNVILIHLDATVQPEMRRELLNASVKIEAEFSHAGAAIDVLRRSAAEKRLLILQMDSINDLGPLSSLSAHFPGWPIIALVAGYEPKTSLGEVVVNIMCAGASQILSLPVPVDDLKGVLSRIAVQYVYSVRPCKVIAVAGATGGSGASTLALNLAYEIADRQELRCVLAELSLRMGAIASHLNIEPVHTIMDLLRNIHRLDSFLTQQVLVRVADNFEVLVGPQKFEPPVMTASRDVARVVDTLKQIADVVVLDVPCTYDEVYFESIAAADLVVLIGEQTLPSIRALKMVRESLASAEGSEHLVINKFDPRKKGFAVQRLLRPLGVSAVHTVACDDLAMSQAMEGACTLRLGASRSPALADIVALADRIMDFHPPGRPKPMGLFGRIGRALVQS